MRHACINPLFSRSGIRAGAATAIEVNLASQGTVQRGLTWLAALYLVAWLRASSLLWAGLHMEGVRKTADPCDLRH